MLSYLQYHTAWNVVHTAVNNIFTGADLIVWPFTGDDLIVWPFTGADLIVWSFTGDDLIDVYIGSSNKNPVNHRPSLDFHVCQHIAGDMFTGVAKTPLDDDEVWKPEHRKWREYPCDTYGRYFIVQKAGTTTALSFDELRVKAGIVEVVQQILSSQFSFDITIVISLLMGNKYNYIILRFCNCWCKDSQFQPLGLSQLQLIWNNICQFPASSFV